MALLISCVVLVLSFSVPLVSAQNDPQQNAALQALVSGYEALLNGTAVQFNKTLAAATANASVACALNVACSGSATNLPLDLYINFTNATDLGLYNWVELKSPNSPAAAAASTVPEVCAMNAMQGYWRNTLFANIGQILWQYFTTADDQLGLYPPSPWNCSRTYIPTSRPYYVAGATGQKDVVILIDTSTLMNGAATRLAWAKLMASKLLSSLSYRDYVSIVLFSDFPFTAQKFLVQATYANVAQLVAYVNAIALPTDGVRRVCDLSGALSAAYDILGASRDAGRTSYCTQTIYLLSSGGNDYFSAQTPPAQLVARTSSPYSTTIVFSYFLNTTSSSLLDVKTLASLACTTKGFFQSIGSPADADAYWSRFNTYFAAMHAFTSPSPGGDDEGGAASAQATMRWSEFYEDGDGQGNVVSVSTPIYRDDPNTSSVAASELVGVLSMDVPLATMQLSNTLTGANVNDYLLSSQVCSSLDHTQSYKAPLVEYLQKDTCTIAGMNDAVNSVAALRARVLAGEPIQANKMKGLIVAVTVVFVLILALVPVFCAKEKRVELFIFAGVFLVCWIIAFSVFYTLVFPDVVASYNYVPTQLTVTSIADNPYRCCDTVNCSCTNFNNGTTCSSLIGDLQEGTCNNGYFCCSRRCYSCNCRSSSYKCGKKRCSRRRCSTCCSCEASVTNQRCNVQCGTCFRPVAGVSYTYLGANLSSHFTTSCGRDNVACRDSFRAEYVVGSKIPGYINPEAPLNVVRSVSIAAGPLAASLVFAGLSIVFLVLTCRLFIQDPCCGRNAQPPPNHCDFVPTPQSGALQELSEHVNADDLYSVPPASGVDPDDRIQWM